MSFLNGFKQLGSKVGFAANDAKFFRNSGITSGHLLGSTAISAKVPKLRAISNIKPVQKQRKTMKGFFQ